MTYQYIKVPKDLQASVIQVSDVLVKQGDRVRAQQTLLYLLADGVRIPIVSPYNGWVVFVYPRGVVRKGQALLVLNVSVYGEYRPDAKEVHPGTELGEQGRRSLERKGERRYGSFAKSLIEMPQQGHGPSLIESHPLLNGRKTGAPPKTSGIATDSSIQENVLDPELKLSKELQQRVDNVLSRAPTPTLSR